jgi:hypothetical protein
MAYIIGINPNGGLFSKTQFRRGDIPFPGTRGQWTNPTDGATREYVSVKFTAGATHINGSLVAISAEGVAVLGSVGAAPALAFGGGVGVLAFATATATQTMAGTAFGWAAVHGKVKARHLGSVTAVGNLLQFGANGVAVQGVAGSASAQIDGIVALASSATAELIDVMLLYPKFAGIPA